MLAEHKTPGNSHPTMHYLMKILLPSCDSNCTGTSNNKNLNQLPMILKCFFVFLFFCFNIDLHFHNLWNQIGLTLYVVQHISKKRTKHNFTNSQCHVIDLNAIVSFNHALICHQRHANRPFDALHPLSKKELRKYLAILTLHLVHNLCLFHLEGNETLIKKRSSLSNSDKQIYH